MQDDTLTLWGQLRRDAHERGKFLGLSAARIAERVGTSPANVTNIITRGAHSSEFASKIDDVLRAEIPTYNDQINELLEKETRGDAPQEIGRLLMAYARLLRDTALDFEFRMTTIDQIVAVLQSFQNQDREVLRKIAHEKQVEIEKARLEEIARPTTP